MQKIQKKVKELEIICEKHNVTRLYLFGSYITGNSHDESDIDFLVTYNDSIALLDFADNYFSMLDSLESLFHNKIDLVVESSLKNPVLIQSINQSKKLIYESKSSEVPA